MVEAIEAFVHSSEFQLVPAIHVNPKQESIRSCTSYDTDYDKPPNYTAAATFPVSSDHSV